MKKKGGWRRKAQKVQKKTVIELYVHTHKHKQHLRLSNKRHDAVLTKRQKKEGTNVRYKKKRSVRQLGNKKQKPKSEVTKKKGFHTKLISKCMRCLPVFPTCSISEKKRIVTPGIALPDIKRDEIEPWCGHLGWQFPLKSCCLVDAANDLKSISRIAVEGKKN